MDERLDNPNRELSLPSELLLHVGQPDLAERILLALDYAQDSRDAISSHLAKERMRLEGNLQDMQRWFVDHLGTGEWSGMQYKFAAEGACCRSVSFDLEDGRLHDVKFIGGCACSGNTRAISKLLEGADARWTADLLRGNECNLRSSSCTAQLAKAIDTVLAE